MSSPLKEADNGVVLRIKKERGDWSGFVSRLKDRISNVKNSARDPSAVREIAIEGHPGVEYRWKKSNAYTILERWYCVGDRLYVAEYTAFSDASDYDPRLVPATS